MEEGKREKQQVSKLAGQRVSVGFDRFRGIFGRFPGWEAGFRWEIRHFEAKKRCFYSQKALKTARKQAKNGFLECRKVPDGSLYVTHHENLTGACWLKEDTRDRGEGVGVTDFLLSLPGLA